MITNITTGCDPARVQQNQPSFYVSWMQNGQMNYEFFRMRSSCELLKTKLMKLCSPEPTK